MQEEVYGELSDFMKLESGGFSRSSLWKISNVESVNEWKTRPKRPGEKKRSNNTNRRK